MPEYDRTDLIVRCPMVKLTIPKHRKGYVTHSILEADSFGCSPDCVHFADRTAEDAMTLPL